MLNWYLVSQYCIFNKYIWLQNRCESRSGGFYVSQSGVISRKGRGFFLCSFLVYLFVKKRLMGHTAQLN